MAYKNLKMLWSEPSHINNRNWLLLRPTESIKCVFLFGIDFKWYDKIYWSCASFSKIFNKLLIRIHEGKQNIKNEFLNKIKEFMGKVIRIYDIKKLFVKNK